MSYFIRQGSRLSISDDANIEVHRSLPVGNYNVKHNPLTGYYLESIDPFPSVGKIYGNSVKWAERILNTFDDRPNTTGVLLSGEKGSGKTLLAKTISQLGAARGMATLTINQPLCGEDFNKFIQVIDVPAIVIFDEFEKVYNEEDQQSLLTLFDGMYPTKKLFVMTCNDKYRIDSHMRNRPGRIYYSIDFTGLDADFVREYCEDNLKNKEHIDSVCRTSVLFSQFNFDMLKALVEEMNRYGEPAQDAMFMLNAKPQNSDQCAYDVVAYVSGKPLAPHEFQPQSWVGNPLNKEFILVIKKKAEESKVVEFMNKTRKVARRASHDDLFDDDIMPVAANPVTENGHNRVVFNPEDHLVSVDPSTNSFLLKNGNITVELTRKSYGDDNFYSRLF